MEVRIEVGKLTWLSIDRGKKFDVGGNYNGCRAVREDLRGVKWKGKLIWVTDWGRKKN